MRLRNTANRYGLIAISFHWAIAVLIIGMLALGLYMVDLPISLSKLRLYGWHKEFGILVLLLATLRISWRLSGQVPPLPGYMGWFQQTAAKLAHYAFYFFMFAMPITGWFMSSAAGVSVSFFGLLTLPDLVSANKELTSLLASIHGWMAWVLIALIAVHVSAALSHHFYYKDDILRRMLPWSDK